MALISTHDNDVRCIGSAFLVAPGLAITAAHVVRDWDDFQEQRDGYRRIGVNFSVTAVQLVDGKALTWLVDGISCFWTGDVAFLRFARPAWWGDGPGQIKPRCARLNMNPPAVGDQTNVFGFPRSRVEDGIVHVSPAECNARVREVALRSQYPFRPTSYVELDGEIQAGMSGGPCFDADWNVVGMCSKGWNFLDDIPDTTPLAYMALLWPAMSIPIDLFKSGGFPAWDLFKSGPAQAVGHHRIHVTAEGEALLAAIDPADLRPLNLPELAEHLEGALNFAGENALKALTNIRAMLNPETPDPSLKPNALQAELRPFFWEVDSAIRLALRLAAVRLGLEPPFEMDWGQFVDLWRTRGAEPRVVDALARLGFAWNGITLFEVRACAAKASEGILIVQCVAPRGPDGAPGFCVLTPSREHAQQVALPDGLMRYYDAARRFSQSVLRLAARHSPGTRAQ